MNILQTTIIIQIVSKVSLLDFCAFKSNKKKMNETRIEYKLLEREKLKKKTGLLFIITIIVFCASIFLLSIYIYSIRYQSLRKKIKICKKMKCLNICFLNLNLFFLV